MIACTADHVDDDSVDYAELANVEVIKDIVLHYSDSAITRVIVKGPEMWRYSDVKNPSSKFVRGVEVEFLDPNGNPQGWLEADYAENKEIKKLMVCRGNVLLYNNKNERLRTSELIWDEKEKIFYTDKFVKITRPDGDIQGYGFKANQNFTEFEILVVEGEKEYALPE